MPLIPSEPVTPPTVNPSGAPWGPPATVHALGNKPLNKVGLHKPIINWLTALPHFKPLGADCLFDCGGTKTLVLNKYSGDLLNPTTSVVETCFFHERAQVLLETTTAYYLLCDLFYTSGVVPTGGSFYTGTWNGKQLLPGVLYNKNTGFYSYPQSPGRDILNEIFWKYTGIVPLVPPPAPMPKPGMGTDITNLHISTAANAGTISGFVRFTQNANGSLNFRGEVIWYPSPTSTSLIFSFPVPTAAVGKSFLPTAFLYPQALTASVAPMADPDSGSVLTTSAWTSGTAATRIIFEKLNIP